MASLKPPSAPLPYLVCLVVIVGLNLLLWAAVVYDGAWLADML